MFALADKCNYGNIKDEQLRDKLCHGMRDRKLAADLRSNEELTLAEVLKRMRSKEAVLKDLQEEKDRVRDTVKQFCGTTHKYGKVHCPAKDAACQSCKCVGHYARMCPKKLKSLTYHEESEPETFSDSEYYVVSSISNHPLNGQWRSKVQVGRYLVNFKVDSGADVTAISVTDFEQLSPRPLCKSSRARLVAAGNQRLETVGVFMAEMKYENVTHHERIFVIKGLDDNLLSRSASDSLFVVEFKGDKTLTLPSPPQALHSLHSVLPSFTPWDPKKLFPECFTGLGLMAAEYKITLRNGAEPYAIASPRRIPHPIRNQVKSQLDQMVKNGVISPVNEPTEWCAAIVPVPKASDPQKVRICVDHIQLNKAIIRERTILPSVEETMAKFAGAKIFSKLDCKDSFWQVQLHPESRLLTTFLTPWGSDLRLKLLPYSYEVQFIPGKDHHIPDWLSRCPSDAPPSPEELKLVAEVTAMVITHSAMSL
ncbi:hypothetical protein B566_EDAN010759 [Ephemera danica]|nr:hypothetical protein B566_EDAN010759 [Ephemera danica]